MFIKLRTWGAGLRGLCLVWFYRVTPLFKDEETSLTQKLANLFKVIPFWVGARAMALVSLFGFLLLLYLAMWKCVSVCAFLCDSVYVYVCICMFVCVCLSVYECLCLCIAVCVCVGARNWTLGHKQAKQVQFPSSLLFQLWDARVGLELILLLPSLTQRWDYRNALSCLPT